jgi:hypothetical protein
MSNFFTLYAEYCKNTEPPPNFHAWSAISALSALIGKKCSIPQGHFTVFPNLYIVLVGDPGMRKSTAMNIAKRLVRLHGGVPVAAESGSREGLLDDMVKNKVPAMEGAKDVSYWQSSAFVTEMQEFLGGKHINGAMIGFLTAIWDEMIYKERTRKGGEVIIHNPYFTMIGCCTPNWMNEKLREDVITDGFSRRTIFVLEEELGKLNPWPESSPNEIQALALLSKEVQRIHDINGKFQLSKEARAIYDAKYMDMRNEALKYSDKVQSYFTSKHILALKVAMCISSGLNSERLIDSEVMKAAFIFLEQSERSLDLVFAGVGRNELKALLQKCLRKIRAAGHKGLSKAEFITYAYNDMNKQEIDEVWECLMTSGECAPTSEENPLAVPRVRAIKPDLRPPAVDLLELASRLKQRPEVKMKENQAFVLANQLDPLTSTLLSQTRQTQADQSSGVLLKGKRTLSADGKQILLKSQVSSLSRGTPPAGQLSTESLLHDPAFPQPTQDTPASSG